MDIYGEFTWKETACATFSIFKDGILLSIAMFTNFIPQLLVATFSGHMNSIKDFDTAALYLLIDSILGALTFAYAIGSVKISNLIFSCNHLF